MPVKITLRVPNLRFRRRLKAFFAKAKRFFRRFKLRKVLNIALRLFIAATALLFINACLMMIAAAIALPFELLGWMTAADAVFTLTYSLSAAYLVYKALDWYLSYQEMNRWAKSVVTPAPSYQKMGVEAEVRKAPRMTMAPA